MEYLHEAFDFLLDKILHPALDITTLLVFATLATVLYTLTVMKVTFTMLRRRDRLLFGTLRKNRGRSVSFSSYSLIQGAFPPEAEVQPPIINSLLLFNDCPSMKDIQESSQPLLDYERFRRTLVFDDDFQTWIFEEAEYDWTNQFSLSVVNGEAELMSAVQAIASEDLPGYGKRPLWHMNILKNTGSGSSAVLIRIHHVIGDGIALVGAMANLFKTESGGPCVIEVPGGTLKKLNSASSSFFGYILKGFKLASSFFSVLTLALSTYDTDTAFSILNSKKTKMTKSRKTIIFPTLKLSFVKELKNKANVTVNDVLLSLTAGAVRRYCISRGDTHFTPVHGSSGAKKVLSRALIPVSFPRSEEELSDRVTSLKNKWAFISAPLALEEGSSTARLSATTNSMNAIKGMPTAAVQLWVQNNLLSWLPIFFQRKTAADVFTRHSMVFSNVPGPQEKMLFAGKPIVGLHAIFPNLLSQVLIVSYSGGVFMNMVVDDESIPDSEKLTGFFLEEAVELAKHYGLSTQLDYMTVPISSANDAIFATV